MQDNIVEILPEDYEDLSDGLRLCGLDPADFGL